MRTYHLDLAVKMPLYEQLYRAIRQDIISGVLQGGERLPSKRRLAEHLEVSQITVESAYSQLLAEGYLVSKPRSGILCSSLTAGSGSGGATQNNTARTGKSQFSL